MYLTFTDKHWVIDIETDEYDASVIWCMCAKNMVTGEEVELIGHDEIKAWLEADTTRIYIGHNAIKFDYPTLTRLLGVRFNWLKLVDTFLLSMLYSPALAGGHSLEAWGVRLKYPKGDFKEFHRFSQKMLEYCMNDVRLTCKIYEVLADRMKRVGFTETACKVETLAWDIIRRQKENGFYFDIERAYVLFAELREQARIIQEKVRERFPAQLLPTKTFKQSRKQNGEPTANFIKHNEIYPRIEENADGTYTAFEWVEFNLGSPPQRVEKLLELGWEPREFTKPSKTHPEGQPKATDKGELVPSLKDFVKESGIDEVKLIANWMAVTGRANAIGNWIDAYNEKTGCIHGNLWLAGSLRYRHDNPNTANIPSVRLDDADHPIRGEAGFWTYEARALWTCRPGNRRLVGVDAKGIQLRVLAHYLNNPAFSEAACSGDPHTVNQKAFNLPSRAITKTITYAIIMGAGDGRIASESKSSLAEAKANKALFFEKVPELPKLIRRLKNEFKNGGRITLCDGARILVPKDYTVIPYLLQGDESRIMKMAAIFVDNEVRKRKLDVIKVGDIHDEWQSDVLEDHVEEYIQICKDCFKRAGEFFDYNVPIECDAKVGKTWAETH